jgi:hypothetical protein
MNPQWPQMVGFLPASKASNPTGKKQIATMMTHAGYPDLWVMPLHLGQEMMANVKPSLKKPENPHGKQRCQHRVRASS